MYAPFGAGVLIGPRRMLAAGDQSLLGSGAAPVLDLDDVARMARPEREEPGSPNVIGAVALGAAIGALEEHRLARHHRPRCAHRPIAAARARGDPGAAASRARSRHRHPCRSPRSPWTASRSALVAARLAGEDAIEVGHGSLHARPYLTRLLGLSPAGARAGRGSVRNSDRGAVPGAVRASAGINTSERDVARLLSAMERLVAGEAAGPVPP